MNHERLDLGVGGGWRKQESVMPNRRAGMPLNRAKTTARRYFFQSNAPFLSA
jgi:hypothetical protein